MGARSEAGQFSLAAVVIALVVVAVLGVAGASIFLGGGTTGSGTGAGVGVGLADDVSAKSTLSQAQSDVASVVATGNYGGITASSLSGTDPNLTFTSGPSSSDHTVSVTSGGGGGGSGGGSASVGGVNIPGGLGATASPQFTAAPQASAASGGSATFATYSSTGTCWYVWLGPGGPLYGAQTSQSSCQAALYPSAPSLGSVSSGAIGWSSDSFPTT